MDTSAEELAPLLAEEEEEEMFESAAELIELLDEDEVGAGAALTWLDEVG